MTNCWYCGSELEWCTDFNFDEVHGKGDGIVTILKCNGCGAKAEFSKRDDEEVCS